MAGPSYEKVEEGEPLEEGAPVEEGVELAARPCVFEVRVLDVKNQGAAHVVRVPEGGRVDDLMGAIEGALAHAPAARQRLIVNGKQLKAGEALAAFGVERGARAAPTVHLMVRPADAPVAVPEASSREETVNPLAGDLASIMAAVAAADAGERAAAAGGGGVNANGANGRNFSAHRAPLETVARSAARVRLLSALLALYCALNGLGALLDATADPATRASDDDRAGRDGVALGTTALFLNVAGVWVGASGLRASQRLDPHSIDTYDKSLRVLAVATLSYEAYNSLVVLPNTLPKQWMAEGAPVNDDALAPAANASQPHVDDDDDARLDDARDNPFLDDTAMPPEAALSRESLILSGFVTVMLWASIWLVCVQNSTRLRLAIRDHGVAAITVADLNAAASRDAFFP